MNHFIRCRFKKQFTPIAIFFCFLPLFTQGQTEDKLTEEVKAVLFAACDCLDSSFADFQPDFKAFLQSPEILWDNAEESYQTLLVDLSESDRKWVEKDMERIENGEIDDAIERCVYHRFPEDYLDELDIDVDQDNQELMQFLKDTNCKLYYLLL